MSNLLQMPKDLQRKVALELSPSDLINFCVTNKNVNVEICESKDFWRLKLEKDYPEVFNYFSKGKLILKNPKNTYIRRFTEVSREVEIFVRQQVHPEYQPLIYDIIYKSYEEYVEKKKLGEDKAVAFENIYQNKLKYPPASIYRDVNIFLPLLNNLVIILEIKRQAYFTK